MSGESEKKEADSKTYQITFERSAQRQFNRLPRHAQVQLRPVIDALANNPRPTGAVAMQGSHGYYRVRSGDYRVIYTVRDAELVVLIVRSAIVARSTVDPIL